MSGAVIAYSDYIRETNCTISVAALTATLVAAGFPLTQAKKRQLSEVTILSFNDALGPPNPGDMIGVEFNFAVPIAWDRIRFMASLDNVGGFTHVFVDDGTSEIEVTFVARGSPDYVATNFRDIQIAGYGIPETNVPVGLIGTSFSRIIFYYDAQNIYYAPVDTNKLIIRRLWISDALIIPLGCDSNWTMTTVDVGRVDTSVGQQAYPQTFDKVRLLNMQFSVLDVQYAWGFSSNGAAQYNSSVNEIQTDVGITDEVIAVPRTDLSLWFTYTAVYGHITQVPTLQHQGGDQWTCTFNVIEER